MGRLIRKRERKWKWNKRKKKNGTGNNNYSFINEVYSKDSINWLKYGNYTNNINIYEERNILINNLV